MKLMVAVVLLITTVTCITNTNINSRISPEFESKEYSHILVIADFLDLELQEKCENKTKSEFGKHQVKCSMSYELFFAGKDYSDEEYLDILDSRGIDAVLIVYPANSGYSQTYVPPRTKTDIKGRVKPDYLGGYKVEAESNTRTYGGYNVSKPWANFEAEMFDAKSGELVWYATSSSSGNAFTNIESLVKAVSGKTVNKLVQDGLIPR